MNTILKKDEITFKDIEKFIYDYYCQLAVRDTQAILELIDKSIMKERDTAKYRHKGLRSDHVRCVYGDVPYERVVYETENEDGHKEYVFLLNEVLKMDTIGKLSMTAVEAIIGSATKMSFRDSAEELNRNTKINISHQGAWDVVQKFGEKLEQEERALIQEYEREGIYGGKTVPVLFEEADGVFLHLQGKDRPTGKSGREIKVSTCYEGWNEDGELVGKVMSVGFEKGPVFQKLREAAIQKKYDTDAVQLRVLNGDGATWVKECEDPSTIFQLDRFHVYDKITGCIQPKEEQSLLRGLYDEGKTEELLKEIQIYADSVSSNNKEDKREKKALELYRYLKENEEYLLSYRNRGISIPPAPKGIRYKNLGVQENQNCSNITLRMKHKKASWSISGGGHMGKILARFANGTIWTDVARYRDAIIAAEGAEIVWNILSASSVPKYEGIKGKNSAVCEGHIIYRDSKMTASRKQFLKIFDNRNFTGLIYR